MQILIDNSRMTQVHPDKQLVKGRCSCTIKNSWMGLYCLKQSRAVGLLSNWESQIVGLSPRSGHSKSSENRSGCLPAWHSLLRGWIGGVKPSKWSLHVAMNAALCIMRGKKRKNKFHHTQLCVTIVELELKFQEKGPDAICKVNKSFDS